jgi:hypothetical protein
MTVDDMIDGHREEMIRQMDEVHDTPLFRGGGVGVSAVLSAIGANHHRQSARQSAERKSTNTALCYPKPIETIISQRI